MKKRGFGIGKWNGVGGKLLAGEGIEQAAVREMEEEIGVKASVADLEKIGCLDFYFPHQQENWNQQVHIFLVKNWQGEPQESEEMAPKWHNFSEIPLDQMWPDDKHWLPLALAGKKFQGEFHFTANNEDFEKFEIKEI